MIRYPFLKDLYIKSGFTENANVKNEREETYEKMEQHIKFYISKK